MSPKRRAGARGQSSVVARLAQKRSRNPLTSRRWVSVDPGGVQRFARWVSFRQVLAALFLLALFTGTAMSQYVVAEMQGDASNEAPVRVRGLAVQGHERLSAGRVAAASGLAPGMLASEIDTAKVAAALNAHEMIRSATVAALPHGKLILRVEEREPVAIVRAPEVEGGGDVLRLVDTTGTPFARAQANDWSRLPRLRSATVLPTDQADPQLLRALWLAALIRQTNGSDREAREIELPSQQAGLGWVLHSQELPRTVILGEDELEPRLEKLSLLLTSNMPAARAAEEIDLRFANQAVLRSRSPSR
ncbi:MAG TPA: FtsQ-type POTRA domain-containing protein [Myxococcales bacterium]|nr:FtsQ-type POTRA domain-containing protein [Myxococcales bacterium]HIM00881.1 FtsQ-type POTRA domain-containing protein [Myxococcales bacterium]